MHAYISHRTTTLLVAAVVVASGLAAAAPAASAAPTAKAKPKATPACGTLFDDFDYASSSDPALARNGWDVRTGTGGPGPDDGVSWSANNISFPTVDGHQSLQLTVKTNGSDSGTSQAEISQNGNRFFAGTYLARMKFSDTPASGADGDHVNQAFFSIGPLAYNKDPNYSELDFAEYLPNGGWGATTHTNSQTSWYTAGYDPDYQDFQENDENVSLNGWHDIMATVSGGHVRYYVDGTLVADHSGKYYPRENMTLDFNQWIIDWAAHSGSGTSTWLERADFVYYAQNKALSWTQAKSVVDGYRATNTSHVDNVATTDNCNP